MIIPAPWWFVAMAGVLWTYWKYFAGSGWPQATAEARRTSFRATKVPAGVWTWALIAALLVLVGQVTVGLLPVVPEIKDWVLDVLAMAGVRGVLLGVALGAILTGMRLLLGVERPYDD